MYRLFVASAVLFSLTGCASTATAPDRQTRTDVAPQAAGPGASGAEATPALPTGAPPKVVEVADFDDWTVCEDVTKPGTRMVVGQRCTPVRAAGRARDDRVEAAMREQEEITRAARERDLERQLPLPMIRR